MKEFEECENLIKTTINTKCRILDKQKILAEIKDIMYFKFGIEINAKYVKNLLLGKNKYKILLEQKKQTKLLQNKTKSEYTEKYCSIELRNINKKIKELKTNLSLDYFQYKNYCNRINKLMNYNNLDKLIVDSYQYILFCIHEHTQGHLSTDTICSIGNKRTDRKMSAIHNISYNTYVQRIEDSRQNRLFRMELSDITQKKKRQIEYKKQITNEELCKTNEEHKQHIAEDKLIAQIKDKLKTIVFI